MRWTIDCRKIMSQTFGHKVWTYIIHKKISFHHLKNSHLILVSFYIFFIRISQIHTAKCCARITDTLVRLDISLTLSQLQKETLIFRLQITISWQSSNCICVHKSQFKVLRQTLFTNLSTIFFDPIKANSWISSMHQS